MKYLLIIIFCLKTFACSPVNGKNIIWESVDNKLDKNITALLINEGYTEMTYYFDKNNNKDGEWKRFGWSKLNNDLILINALKTPKAGEKEYNFLIIFSLKTKQIIYTSKAYYDYYIDGFFQNDEEKYYLKLELISEDDSPFEYDEIEILKKT